MKKNLLPIALVLITILLAGIFYQGYNEPKSEGISLGNVTAELPTTVPGSFARYTFFATSTDQTFFATTTSGTSTRSPANKHRRTGTGR